MTTTTETNRRILVIDDYRATQEEIRGILEKPHPPATGCEAVGRFVVDLAGKPQLGVDMVGRALGEGRPYAAALIDGRAQGDWDGVATVPHLWRADPNLGIVVCVDGADTAWQEPVQALGESDCLVVLRRPFDAIEVRQLLCAVCRKWELDSQLRNAVGDLEQAVAKRTAELRHHSDQLLDAHAYSRQLLEAVSSVLIGVSGDGRVTVWNGAAERTLGVKSDDALGRLLGDVSIDWDRAAVSGAISRCWEQGCAVTADEMEFTRPDETRGLMSATVNPVKAGGEAGRSVLIVATDVTQQKVLQGQLAQAQKLESIGQLAAGIAHEINTPTQFVSDNTRFVQKAFPKLKDLLVKYGQLLDAVRGGAAPPELIDELDSAIRTAKLSFLLEQMPEAIADALEGLERVSRIVRAMKDFSHPGEDDMCEADLNHAIESTITVARNEWKYVAEMALDLDPELPPVPCVVGDFNQVILNMVVNAAHAIADVVGDGSRGKGTITVSTRGLDQAVEIRISDTGTGIAEAHRSKVFDHFFTTKEVGKGTGQGLAIAHSVVTEKHGGSIALESEVGQGTTFIIRLPIHENVTEFGVTPTRNEVLSSGAQLG